LTFDATRATIAESMTIAAIVVAAAFQAAAPDPGVPTAIEHAIVGYECRAIRAASGEGSDADLKCYNDTLAALRADFGRDLSRITPADRKNLDSACGLIDTERREAYLQCLSGQLAGLRSRRSRGKPAASAATPASEPPPADGAASDVPVAAPTLPPVAGVPSTLLWIGAGIATVVLLAGGFLVLRARRPLRNCRICGEPVYEGDLCAKCRHDAAETARRAAIQRAEADRVERERRERLAQLQEDQVREQARREQELRARQDEEIQRLEQLKILRQDEERQQRSRFGVVVSEEAFDPHAALGISADASRQEIDTAYQAAKSKYDLSQVSHLGPELQEYYKSKAAAADRAYKMLTEEAGTGEAGGAAG
jgi:hypothetical protein